MREGHDRVMIGSHNRVMTVGHDKKCHSQHLIDWARSRGTGIYASVFAPFPLELGSPITCCLDREGGGYIDTTAD